MNQALGSSELFWPPTGDVVRGGHDLRERLIGWVRPNWDTVLHGTTIGEFSYQEPDEYVRWLQTGCGGDFELAMLGLIYSVTVVVLVRPQGGSARGDMMRAPEYVPNFALFSGQRARLSLNVCKTKTRFSG